MDRKRVVNGQVDGGINGCDPLKIIGKWFLSYKKNQICWQGQILATDGIYVLVQLYSWASGQPSNQQLVRLGDMLTWKIFDTDKEMRDESRKQWENPTT